MRYSEVDNSYVQTSVERISAALTRITDIPVRIWPAPIESEVVDQSFWVVLAVLVKATKRTSDLNTQVWRIYAELVYRPHVQEYDATIYSAVSLIFAQAYNYLFAHQNLKFLDTDAAVLYLQDEGVDIQMNAMNTSGQPGMSIVSELPFQLNIEQERT